jgi:hypothetical protein
MGFFKNVLYLLASVFSVLTVAVAAWGGLTTVQSSSTASSAETSYLLYESELATLEDEDRAITARLLEIPDEQTSAWRLCTNVIMDEVFGTGATAADEAGCEEWRQLEAEKDTLTAREGVIPQQTLNTRDKKNEAQVESLVAGRAFDTTLGFVLGGTALLATVSVLLWVFGARASKRNAPV